MCHNDNRFSFLIEPPENFQNLFSGLRIQIAGGLIGQNYIRVIHEGPGDCDALPFPAAQFRGLVLHAVVHPHHGQQLAGGFGILLLVEHAWQQDVLPGRESRHQIEKLEHESDIVLSENGQFLILHPADLASGDADLARRRRVIAYRAILLQALASESRGVPDKKPSGSQSLQGLDLIEALFHCEPAGR